MRFLSVQFRELPTTATFGDLGVAYSNRQESKPTRTTSIHRTIALIRTRTLLPNTAYTRKPRWSRESRLCVILFRFIISIIPNSSRPADCLFLIGSNQSEDL
jgi:hypothetical protein